jgi:sulfur carrier protein
MKVIVNGTIYEIDPDESTVAEILTYHKVTRPEMVSVQLNERFVEHDQFGIIKLVENDELEFIYFMGGGQ